MIPQYARTTDPRVVVVVEENHRRREDFIEKSLVLAAKYANGTERCGGPNAFFYRDQWGLGLSGIASDEKPTAGQWTERQKYGWRPYKNNPVYREMKALNVKYEPIPGLPDTLINGYRGGEHYWLTPTIFVQDGAAYLGFSMVPGDEDQSLEDGYGWEEILPSAWHLAVEATEAARKKESADA